MNTLEELREFIENTPMALIYFSTNTCSACSALKPKVKELVKDYEKMMKMIEIKADESIQIASQLNIFMLPAILLYIDGKEVLRESKYISIMELKEKLNRYYNLYT